MTMKFKRVDKLDFEISAVGFGCWAAGGSSVWNNADDDETVRTIQRAIELGVNFFDVAPVYGFGHAETMLGKAITGQRDDIIIATKCGLVWDDANNISNNLVPESIEREIDASLRRLNTDYVDIYQLHWPDPNTPIEDTMGVMEKLKQAGKIRHVGVSNFSVELADKARAVETIVSHQGLYSLLERNPPQYHNIPLEYRTEDEILPDCEQHGMAFFPYSPLFQGLLTDGFKLQGNFDANDVRSANPNLSGEKFQQYYQVRQKLVAFAESIGKPLSQVAINWLIEQPQVTSVICGAQQVAHIEENVGSISWTLTPEMLSEIGQILQPHADLIQR